MFYLKKDILGDFMQEELISVIMGVYNSKDKEKLKRAIYSILNQTYKNIEFIICNDASTDNTQEILEEIAKKDNRIILIKNEENRYLCGALNHCIEYANGKYIARMDDDDYSYPERFAVQKDFLDNNPEYGFVGCHENMVWNEKKWGEYCPKEKVEPNDLLKGVNFSHPTIMVRKEVYENIPYRESNETKRAEDYDWYLRAYARGIRGYNINRIMFDYTTNPEDGNYQSLQSRLQVVKVMYKGFKINGLLPKGYIYMMRPIIAWLIPENIMSSIRHRRWSNK